MEENQKPEMTGEEIQSELCESLINKLSLQIHQWSLSKGFFSPTELHQTGTAEQLTTYDMRICQLILPVIHLARAIEALRHGKESNYMNEVHRAIEELITLNNKSTTIRPNQQIPLIFGKLSLILSEIGEAAEAAVKNNYTNFAEELADAVMRIFQQCGAMGIPIGSAILSKMQVNADRPQRHGKVSLL